MKIIRILANHLQTSQEHVVASRAAGFKMEATVVDPITAMPAASWSISFLVWARDSTRNPNQITIIISMISWSLEWQMAKTNLWYVEEVWLMCANRQTATTT
jgi:hypothetical protein